MGITATTPQDVFNSFIVDILKIIQEEIVRSFSYLGEKCVARIRDRAGNDSWFDQTGNLRSSIGYAVVDHGRKCIESAFSIIKNGGDGAKAGKELIDNLTSLYSNTYALVVVAGMEYADYVEAMENKDVLASTELWAKSKMQEYLDKSLERAETRISELQHKLGL